MFLIKSILSELRCFFVKIVTSYKRDLKHAVTMPLHQGYCSKYIYMAAYSFIVRNRWDPRL